MRTPGSRVRPFLEQDIAQVAALHTRVFTGSAASGSGTEAYRQYFADVFLDPAAAAAGLSSLVYERDGDIRGFLGVRPLRMRFRGRPILAALCSQFAIDPSERGRAGLQMLKACFAGPQDLSISDEAGDTTRRMWEWCGGSALLPYSIHWIRPLRPAQAALAIAARHLRRVPGRAVLTSVTKLLDGIAGLRSARRTGAVRIRGSREDLYEALFLDRFTELTRRCALVPDYTAQSLAWVFTRLTHGSRVPVARRQIVNDESGKTIGSFIYAIADDRVAEILHITAAGGAARLVLDHLVNDAQRHDAVALTGRLDPALTPELSERHNFLYRRGHWTLAHSEHVELVHALQRGDAFLSRLEGEWCLRFTP